MYRAVAATISALGIGFLALTSSCDAEAKRVALVVGNAGYQHATELKNPRNDARDIGAVLEQLGFNVISGFDLGHAEMGDIIQKFAAALNGASVGVFYYAGHGIQINGANYLVPIDSRLDNEFSADFELIRVDIVQRIMESRYRTNILFLDACRDNPLARNLARAMGTRSAFIGRGLATTESGIGTLVSFSTQPGNVALDGEGRNSPFAEALKRHLAQSSSHIADLLVNVRRDVIQLTNYRQVPWEHSALTDRFYFSPPADGDATPPPPALPPLTKPIPQNQIELARRLNRELRRVGCNPGSSDDRWDKESRSAMERFASVTKRALHTDEPTFDALQVLIAHKLRVCGPPAASPPQRKSVRTTSPPPQAVSGPKDRCRLEKWSECAARIGYRKGGGARGCTASQRRMLCSD